MVDVVVTVVVFVGVMVGVIVVVGVIDGVIVLVGVTVSNGVDSGDLVGVCVLAVVGVTVEVFVGV